MFLRYFQGDIDKLTAWENTWAMELNFSKCKVMHFSKKNKNFQYFLKDKYPYHHILDESKIERDLGFMISNDLKWADQENHAVPEANRSISILKDTFTNLDVRSFKQLYGALIRPRLEYAVGIWSLYLRKDILKLENVQRRATKMVKRIKNLSYSERLKTV